MEMPRATAPRLYIRRCVTLLGRLQRKNIQHFPHLFIMSKVIIIIIILFSLYSRSWCYKSKHSGSKSNVVYMIESTQGAKYVGKTTSPLNHRMSQHRHAIKAGHGDGGKFMKYYQKKENNFNAAKVKVLYQGRSDKYLDQKEKEFIKKYDTVKNGLNSVQ